VRRERNWKIEEVKLLKILGEIFAHVLRRKALLGEFVEIQKKLEEIGRRSEK